MIYNSIIENDSEPFTNINDPSIKIRVSSIVYNTDGDVSIQYYYIDNSDTSLQSMNVDYFNKIFKRKSDIRDIKLDNLLND